MAILGAGIASVALERTRAGTALRRRPYGSFLS